MAYTYRDAIATAYAYLEIDESKVKVIEDTSNRGIIYPFDGVETVIFIYPISCKQNNKQNFFDTRDSGAKERIIAWEYACKHNLPYFCLGFNSEQERYRDYVLSLESDEKSISDISFRKADNSDATGTQVNIPNDFIPTKKFERIKTPKGFYIAAIKKEFIAEYIRMFDNRPYLDTDEMAEGIDIDEADLPMDEYQRAATMIKKYVEDNEIFLTDRSDIEKTRKEFIDKFGPDVLESLADDQVLEKMFYTLGDNTDSLCCWIEMNKECKAHFGSISGGSAYKFGLFQRQDNGKWQTGSAPKPVDLTHEEALVRGKAIRDALVKGCHIIEDSNLKTIKDYEQLDSRLKDEISNEYAYYNWAWFQKYFSIIFPEKLSSYHSNEWQIHVLRCFGITPSEKYYGRSGQISMIQNYAGWVYRQFADALNSRFGGIKQFIRLGSSDENRGYASEWKQKSIVGIGWPDLGSLEEYRDEDGRLDKDHITERLKEAYYPTDLRTASRKAGELIRFYESNNDSVFVVMEGERLVGFVDNLGNYEYDESSNMGHVKGGKWRNPFNEDDRLPNKSEGLRTSCVQFKDDENLLYLYKKYYYANDLLSEEREMTEEKPKNCLQIERTPRTDTTHPMNLIIYGAPGTGKTYSTAEYALAIIENREVDLSKKSPDQRKAVMAKYNDFVRKGQVVFTTFHQSYGYEEFIQGLRPDTKSDKMTFKTVDGVFKHIADVALNDLENNYVIIIDEINRANISKVFGELITLIEDDKRWGEINETCATLQSGDVFAVPNNLYIIGTMNSADKSISLIDAALRRRFIFREQRPNADLITDPKLKAFFERLNAYLYDSLGSADLLVGHSYFMGKTTADLPNIMNDSIIPLLYEYFYDNKKNVNKAIEDTMGKVDYTVVDNKTGRIFVIEKE